MALENLRLLHNECERIRAQSLSTVEADAECLEHLSVVESWMEAILTLATKVEAKNKDDLTVQALGIRLFNSVSVTIEQALAGYYQVANTHVRDVLEVGFLLADFQNDKSRIKLWREMAEKARKEEFAPARVRLRLDTAAGHTTKQRALAYGALSKYASHATPEGFVLLQPDGKPIKAGPFFHFPFLEATISELAMRLAGGVLAFSEFFVGYAETADLHDKLLSATDTWRQKYFELPLKENST